MTGPTGHLTILLVENHEDTITYVRRFLEHYGHEVRVGRNMQEALERVEEKEPDVILSDIGLPDGDGWNLLQRLRLKTKAYAIAMSGFGGRADLDRSLAAGYQDHLVKPFAPNKLLDALRRAEQCRRNG
jgi:two-component system CheB/CheR fusion protein